MDPFVHLHVASGYSLQYGAAHPQTLVERAVEQEMDTLALTDRDGVYGAVKFAMACRRAGIRPVLGVDLAHQHAGSGIPAAPGSRRTPARGGAHRDLSTVEGGPPRATLLAHAGGPAGGHGTGGRAGWAALCRLVSAVHLAGERGRPVLDPGHPEVRALLGGGRLVVLLGPDSDVGVALARRGTPGETAARAALARWRRLVPTDCLRVELVSHRLSSAGPGGALASGSAAHAARMARFARDEAVGSVLTNTVRYADRLGAPVVDVLDAARRLVALGSAGLRHPSPTGARGNAEGYLKGGKEMAEVAEEICRLAGLGESAAVRLLAETRRVADRCALDPRADLGLGEVHLPDLWGRGGLAVPAESADRPSSAPLPREDRPSRLLRARCEGAIGDRYGSAPRQRIWKRLDDELAIIGELGLAPYFLTVADITDLIRERGIRCAARGSGAGSLVNHLLGVSGVDPIRHDLLMERFCSPLRRALPDIDLDVESARRPEIYEAILDRYGGERCVCVSMMDTYRVRHAVRDVGAALGLPPGETGAIAKAFPHIRARDARAALRDLPELRASGLGEGRLDLLFSLVERLDGLPRHIAVHPCGVLLSDLTLLDRTPVEASFAGYPMSQFDKDDVEALGLLKLDILGIRMQSAMAHAVAEIARVDRVAIDLDDPEQVPDDDPATYAMISAARTLGVFQIESPGQRELVGRSGIGSFADIITDISLFRPGPVKSDMVTPYLDAKQGWAEPAYLHDDLRPILRDTGGVVVFHEQLIEIIARFARVGYAESDERRRALGDVEGMAETRRWFVRRAVSAGYEPAVVERLWRILAAFASFGFCKAHAAAFALPTFQSAWLKEHWPAHFLAGVLTHDPGMYPKRLLLDDARQCGVTVLPLDVNVSGRTYVVEPVDGLPREASIAAGWPDGSAYGIRLPVAEVKGIAEAEVDRIVAGAPYASLTDLWHRAHVARPVVERLVLAGGFDGVYRIGAPTAVHRRTKVTRRDLLLQVSELDRFGRAMAKGAARGRPRRTPRTSVAVADAAAQRNSTDPRTRDVAAKVERHVHGDGLDASTRSLARTPVQPSLGSVAEGGIWLRASAQSRATATPAPPESVQLALDLGDEPGEGEVSGLPELDTGERMRAELEILGLDVSSHALSAFTGFLDELGVVRSADLLKVRSRSEILVAGVKVATQTPPVRSGRRVVFVTLDDMTGPVDATFFEDAQGRYAATVFGCWLQVIRGVVRRTGYRGVSVRATGAWDLGELYALRQREGVDAVHDRIATPPEGQAEVGTPAGPDATRRRVLTHSSGFRMSPYADVRPAGDSVKDGAKDVARRLWHRSPGSPG